MDASFSSESKSSGSDFSDSNFSDSCLSGSDPSDCSTSLMDFEELKNEEEITVNLSHEKWQKLVAKFKKKNKKGDRYSMNSGFKQFLKKSLQKQGVNCFINSVNNWFKKRNSQKKDSPYWSGKYKCTICDGILRMSIERFEESFIAISN